jgi:hypothetical protein
MKSILGMIKPIGLVGVLLGSVAFSLLLTFSDPNVVRARLHLSAHSSIAQAAESNSPSTNSPSPALEGHQGIEVVHR